MGWIRDEGGPDDDSRLQAACEKGSLRIARDAAGDVVGLTIADPISKKLATAALMRFGAGRATTLRSLDLAGLSGLTATDLGAITNWMGHVPRLAVPLGLPADQGSRFGRLVGLESLDLSAVPEGGRPTSWLEWVPWVRDLTLGAAAGDADLVAASRLSSLRRLEIRGSDRITAAGLAALAAAPALRDLVIWLSSLDAAGVAALATAPLRSLEIHGGGLGEQDFAAFRDGCLESLILPQSLHDAAGLRLLSRLAPVLRELSLRDWELQDSDLDLLHRFSALESLDLSGCEWLGAAGLQRVGRLRSLRSLNLSGCRGVTDRGLTFLRGLSLAALELPPVAWDDESLAAVVECCGQQRETLEVTATDVSAATCVRAIERWQPSRVVLRGMHFDDSVMPALAADANLHEVDLTRTSVTIPGLARLGGKSLESLEIPPFLRTDEGLSVWLRAVRPRAAYDFSTWRISAAGVASLPITSPTGRPFSRLVLPGSARDDAGLAEWLRRVSPGPRLDLRGWRISDASLPILAAEKRIVSLDLRGTRVTADRLDAFPSRRLRGLKLSRGVMGPAAQIRVWQALGRSGRIRLRVPAVGLSPDEVRLLASTGATGLDITVERGLSEAVLATFRDESQRLASLTSLTVRSSSLGDVAIDLVEGLPSLDRLDLSRVNVTDAGLRRLARRPFRRVEVPPQCRGPFRSVRAFVAELPDPPGTVVNSIGMRLVPIEPGTFRMGQTRSGEEQLHTVTLTRPFLIGMTAVTQDEFGRVMGSNPSATRGGLHPVDHVPWQDAVVFCERLSALPEERAAGRSYRLPSEAEWEYCCRAGTTSPWNVGEDLPRHLARFSQSFRIEPAPTAPVRTYPPNAWGLFEMHGNVWEWTADWFDAGFYERSRRINPMGPPNGTHHTARGGSASVLSHECRSAIRGEALGDMSGVARGHFARLGDFGLRVVCEMPLAEGLATATHRLLDRHLSSGEPGEVVMGLSLLRVSGAGEADLVEALSKPVLRWIVEHALLGKSGVRPEILEPLLECAPAGSAARESLDIRVACRFAALDGRDRRRSIIDSLAAVPSLQPLHRLLAAQPEAPAAALDHLQSLSPSGARRLARHKGSVSLAGLREVSGEVREILAGVAHLRLGGVIGSDPAVRLDEGETGAALMRRARSDQPPPGLSSHALSVPQRQKIQGLLESQTADGMTLGLSLLESLEATQADYAAVFTDAVKKAVSPIVNEWLQGGDATRAEYLRYHAAVVRPAFLAAWGPATEPAKSFIDLVDIPAGSFTMGSPENEADRNDHENQVQVRITKPFQVGRTVVTQDQWRAVMGTDPWRYEDEDRYEGCDDEYIDYDFPAVYVSWDDAVLFCETLTALERETGRLAATQSYRLPTEAEWEYACRAGTTTAYSFGDDPNLLDEHGWYGDNSDEWLNGVAEKKPNPWGLFDMHGNVWEWCADWYDATLAGGDDPVGPAAGSGRVRRGGSWDNDASSCRSACRDHFDPWRRCGYYGFRVVVLR